MTKGRSGRDAAEATWDSIIGYITKTEDKNAEFSTRTLRKAGEYGYSPRGFTGLMNGGAIRYVRKEYIRKSRPLNVYVLGDRLIGRSLDEIKGLSYRAAMVINNK